MTLCIFGSGNALTYQCFHLIHLLEHILCQSDLAAGTDQIVVGVYGLEVFVPVQIVRKESSGQLNSNAEAAERQGIDFLLGQGVCGHRQEALCKCTEHLHIDPRLFIVAAVFFHEVCSEANGITEVIAHNPGHNRIQIDDNEGLPCFGMEQHIVDFGVVIMCFARR